jgi:hypothetical protein
MGPGAGSGATPAGPLARAGWSRARGCSRCWAGRPGLPAALAAGTYMAAPEPRVIGQGLQHIEAALDAQRDGVSAAKIVVSLDDE